MSDLISRQDALDAFGLSEKTRKYGGDHSGYDTRMLYEIQDVLESLPSAAESEFEFCTFGNNPCKEYDYEKHCCHRWTKVIRQTIDEMKAANDKRWIPIKEDLPEECVDVLIQIGNKDGVEMAVSQRRDVNYWSGYGRCVNVIAWQPLPEPMKEGE